jgi:hypothetical protein
MAVQQFMNKIEFSLAAEPVRKRFEEWKIMLEVLSGKNFPVGLGPPEDIALGAQQRPAMPEAGVPEPGMAPGIMPQ